MRKSISTFVALSILTATCSLAIASNLAAFEQLANTRFKKLKNKTQEEFFNTYGKPSKTKKEEKDGKVYETHTYIEDGCRFRFTFVNKIFKSGLRNCM